MSTTFYTDPSFVTMLSTTALDGRPMGTIFYRLVENDRYIADNFTNVIGIWQCNWYYDNTERGYPKGHLCWLNTEEPMNFLKKNHDIIQEYTDLRSSIINKLPDFDATDSDIVDQYYSAMTGYVDPTVGITKPLEPIFDIGDYEKVPQLVVSLKDNNKDSTSVLSSWKRLFIDEEDGVSTIYGMVDSFLDEVLSTHMVEYHLSGKEAETSAILSNYLDELKEKTSICDLSNFFYMDFNSRKPKKSGIDYVLDYVRKPYKLSGTVSEYQAMRVWHSGIVEHFGTISKNDPAFILSDYLVIPFDWKFVGNGAKAYEYGGISEILKGMLSVVETDDSNVSPIDNIVNATYSNNDYSISGHTAAIPFSNTDYSIVVSPTYQNLSGINENFPIAMFGSDAADTKWNNNYILNVVDSKLKTKTFCAISIADTRLVAPYISYYAVGRGRY